MSVRITFSDGGSDVISTERGALGVIANRYGVAASELVTDASEERTLVWLSEQDAENDNGHNAVAEIRPA